MAECPILSLTSPPVPVVCGMRKATITVPQLAERLGISRRHAQRLALEGSIPGAVRTPGGHFRIPSGRALDRWAAAYGSKAAHRAAHRALRRKVEPLESGFDAYLDALPQLRARCDRLVWLMDREAGGGFTLDLFEGAVVAGLERSVAETMRTLATVMRSEARTLDKVADTLRESSVAHDPQ